MQLKTLADKKRLILGLGQTGLSVARFLHQQNQQFKVMDTRQEPSGLDELLAINSDAYLVWNPQLFNEFDELVVSPGIAKNTPEILEAEKAGVKVIGDIELFAQVNQVPVIAITGSNGKSTVTELVATLINASGKKALIVGNFGVPALDLVNQDADFMVLELSSFQLETTYKLKPIAATILNICEDHLDRYQSYQDYITAKRRIYRNAETIVINHNDENTWSFGDEQISFAVISATTAEEETLDWVLDSVQRVIRHKDKKVISLAELSLQGMHNALNVAAAFALLDAVGIEINDAVLAAAKNYQGLPHRCQFVAEKNGVHYINDSKATNVGATVAAIESFAALFEQIILIAGGDAKGADLSALQAPLESQVSALIVFGKDAKALSLLLLDKSYLVENMAQALVKSQQLIQQNQWQNCLVLLSPACASLDSYKNYQERGEEFMKLARALAC